MASMNLTKAYDKVDRDTMWRVVGMCNVNSNLLSEIKYLYAESEACV